MADKMWRQEIELLQNYGKHKAFTFTTSSSSAEDAVTLAGIMAEANKVSFVVELADAYIEFDDDATTSSMLIPQNEGYFVEGVCAVKLIPKSSLMLPLDLLDYLPYQ